LDAVAKLAGCPSIPRENDGHVAERHLVRLRNRLLQRLGMGQGQHRPEDFLVSHGHRGVDIAHDGWAKKEPLALHVSSSVYEECPPLGVPLVDIVGDPISVLSTNQRPNIYARLVSWSDDELARLLTQRAQEVPRRVPDGHCDTAGQAALASITKGRAEDR